MTESIDWESRIAAVQWQELRHAYGEASDVPELLRACITDPEAPWELAGSIVHQGSLYTSTPAALPILAAMIVADACVGRVAALEVIDFFGSSVYAGRALTDEHSGVAGPEFDAQSRAAFRECLTTVAALGRSTDAEVAEAVVAACSWLDIPLPAVTELLTDVARPGVPASVRADALLGLSRQGQLAPDLARKVQESGETIERFAVAWGEIIGGRETSESIAELVATWDVVGDFHKRMRVEDPTGVLAELRVPWPLLDTMIAAGAKTAKDAATALSTRLHIQPGDADEIVARARALARHPDPEVRASAGSLLAEAGHPEEAKAVTSALLDNAHGPLPPDVLALLLTSIRIDAAPERWQTALLEHLDTAPAPVMTPVPLDSMTTPLPSAMRWAGVPCTPELLRRVRAQLAAACIDPGPHNQRVVGWASLVAEWGADATDAAPEILAALPLAPNPCETALAEIGGASDRAFPPQPR